MGDKFMNPYSNYIQLDLAQEYDRLLDGAVTTIIDRKIGRILKKTEERFKSQERTEDENIGVLFSFHTQSTEMNGSNRISINCPQDGCVHTPIDIKTLRGKTDIETIKRKITEILLEGRISMNFSTAPSIEKGYIDEIILAQAPLRVWKKVREDYLNAVSNAEKESQAITDDGQDTRGIGTR